MSNVIAKPKAQAGHTPGPWIVAPHHTRTICSIADRRHEFTLVMTGKATWGDEDTPPYATIALVPHRLDTGILPPSRQANARLIAAAPTLLSAIQALIMAAEKGQAYVRHAHGDCQLDDRNNAANNDLLNATLAARSAVDKAV